MKSNLDARMAFDNAVRNMQQAGFNVSQYVLTQSYLRFEKLIEVGRTNYTFPILTNEALPVIYNTEQRLNLQDSFCINEIFIGLYNPSSAVDATKIPLTYPSPEQLGGVAADAAAFNTLYNGKLQISSKNKILVSAWDVTRHYYAPETQQTDAWGPASPLDEKDLAVDGFYPMEPNVTLIGSLNNRIELLLPEGVTGLGGNAFVRICIILRGILAQNSTIVN